MPGSNAILPDLVRRGLPMRRDAILQAIRTYGLSVKQLANAADLDQSALNRFADGTRTNIRLDVAE